MNNNNMYDEYNNQTNNMNNSQTYINSNNTMNNNPTYVNSNNPNNNQFINPNNGNSTYVNPNINMANNNANGNQYVNPNYSMDNSMYVNPNDLNNKKKKNPLKIVTTVTGILIVLFLAGFGLVYTGVIKINYVSPKSMLLNVGNVALKKGREYQLEYQVYPENTSVKNVYFESSDPSVMEVNEVTGYVTAKKNGSAYVVVKTKDNQEVVDTTLVTVTNDLVPAEKLILSSEKLVFDLSNTTSKLLKVSTEPSNATDKKFDFFSGDENVAVVDEKGYVTPVGFGRTKINVTTKDGSVKTACDVVVTDSKNKKVYFTGIDNKKIIYPYAIELETDYIKLKPETTRKVGFTLLPPDVTEDVVSWISADSKIATVKDGVVRGEGLGITTVTAITVNDLVAKLTVEITNEDVEITELETREESITLTVGEKKNVNLKYNAEATNNIFNYSSNDINIATINDNGVIEAINVGETDVIITTKKHLQVTIHVVVNPLPSNKDLAIDEKDINLDVGSTIELPNTNSDGEKINGSWIIDDDSVISIDDDDVAQGTIDGTTNIGYVDNDGNVTYLPVSSNSVLPTKLTIESYENIKLGDNTKEIQYTFEPVNTTDKSIKWSYSEEGIIEIDEQNIIKTLKVGKVTVTATSVADENIFTTFDVTVTKKDVVDSKPSTSKSNNNNNNNNNNNSNDNSNNNNNNGNSGSNDNNTGNGSSNSNNTNNNVIEEDKETTIAEGFRKNRKYVCVGLYPYKVSEPDLSVPIGAKVSYTCQNSKGTKMTYKGVMTADEYSDFNVSNVTVYKGESFSLTASIKVNGITTDVPAQNLKLIFLDSKLTQNGSKLIVSNNITEDYEVPMDVYYNEFKKSIIVKIKVEKEKEYQNFSVLDTEVFATSSKINTIISLFENGKIVSNISDLPIRFKSLDSSIVKVENNILVPQDVTETQTVGIVATIDGYDSLTTKFYVKVKPVYKDFQINDINNIFNGTYLRVIGTINRNGKTINLSNNDFSSISFDDSRISYSNNIVSYDNTIDIKNSKITAVYTIDGQSYSATATANFVTKASMKLNDMNLYPGECKSIDGKFKASGENFSSKDLAFSNISVNGSQSIYVNHNKICAKEINNKEDIKCKVTATSKVAKVSADFNVTVKPTKYSNLEISIANVEPGKEIIIKATVKKNNQKIEVTKNDLILKSMSDNIVNKGNLIFLASSKVVEKESAYIEFALKDDPAITKKCKFKIQPVGDYVVSLSKTTLTTNDSADVYYEFPFCLFDIGCSFEVELNGNIPGLSYNSKNKKIETKDVKIDKVKTAQIVLKSKGEVKASVSFKIIPDEPKYHFISLSSKTVRPGDKNVSLTVTGMLNGQAVPVPISDVKLSSTSNLIAINDADNTISVSENIKKDTEVSITASLRSNPSIKTTSKISIKIPQEVSDVNLSVSSVTLTKGKTYKVPVSLKYGDRWMPKADIRNYVTFTSSNTKLATVDSNGLVTIVADESEHDQNVVIYVKLRSNTSKQANFKIKIPGVNKYTNTCHSYKKVEYKCADSKYSVKIGSKCYLKAKSNACQRKDKRNGDFRLYKGTCYNFNKKIPASSYETGPYYTSSKRTAKVNKYVKELKCKVSCDKLNSSNVKSNCK